MAKRKGQKEKQHNGLKKRDKDLQSTTQKTNTKMQHNALSAILMTKIKHINSLPKSTHEQHVIYEIENHDF